MPCYIVTVESESEASLAKVAERIRTYPVQCPMLKTSWAVVTEKSAPEVRDHLVQVMMPSERLFVIQTGGAGAWRNSYGEKHNEWLKKYL